MELTAQPIAQARASASAWMRSLSSRRQARITPTRPAKRAGRRWVTVMLLISVVLRFWWCWSSGFEHAQVVDVDGGRAVDLRVELVRHRSRPVVAAAEYVFGDLVDPPRAHPGVGQLGDQVVSGFGGGPPRVSKGGGHAISLTWWCGWGGPRRGEVRRGA